MNKIPIFLCFLLLCSGTTSAQFYYNDLVVNRQHLYKHQLYKQNKVNRILVRSADPDAPGAEGLAVEQIYNSGYTQLKTKTSTVNSRSSITNYYNAQGQMYRTVDSAENAVTVYEYQYDQDRIAAIISTSNTPGEKLKSTESHTWKYAPTGVPELMIRVRDRDTMEIRLLSDDKGMVTEEQIFRKGAAGEKTYYYYDDAGRLSDVVRYQDKQGKLIPDYTFDYDADGRVISMMVVQNGGADYLTWRSEYDNRGLLTREVCLNKQKKVVGKVEYRYEMKK